MATQNSGKIRVRLKDGGINVKAILRHPMETGSRKNPTTGEVLPRQFIREVVCERNGSTVLTMDWSWGIAADPYLSFRIKQGKKGDLISIRWSDNVGKTGHLEASVG